MPSWLQQRLEWFRFPVELVPEEHHPGHPRYLRPVYRDKTNLEMDGAHYWLNIRRALEESRYLILLCSPHSAQSRPVDMEVSHFLESHSQRQEFVVPVLLSGGITPGEQCALSPSLLALDRLCLYHAHTLVATHPRCYERHRDFEDPDHVKDIREQRRRARDASWLLAFYALSPRAEYYHQQLSVRSLQARLHVNRIVALADIYGAEKVARALEDAIECQAFASQYIENILQQRARLCPPSGPLHLTRRADLLDLDLDTVDLTPYDLPEPTP